MKKQKLAFLIFMAIFLVYMVVRWISATADSYVKLYIGHYQEVSETLESNNAYALSEENQQLRQADEETYRDWQEQNLKVEISTESQDGITLNGTYYSQKSNVTVLYLHSFDETGESDFLMAPYYYEKGFDICTPDARNHGESGGEYTTYGINEQMDVQSWVQWIRENVNEQQTIIIHGDGMGAAAAIMANPDNIAFMVSDSCYTALDTLSKKILKDAYHLPEFPIWTIANSQVQKKYGFDLMDIQIQKDVMEVSTPILFIQGGQDLFLQNDDAEVLYNNCGSENKELLIIDDASHKMSYTLGQSEIENDIDKMIKSYVD